MPPISIRLILPAIWLWLLLNHSKCDKLPAKVTNKTGAVASNAGECAPIGADVLRLGGSAADAAIAVALCEEVASPESAGLGGGFLLTYYHRSNGTVEVLDAREIAAGAADRNMFRSAAMVASGGLSIATPGALKGYWVLHQRYGKLPWKRIFEPIVELCRRGHTVGQFMAEALQVTSAKILASPSLAEVFVNPSSGEVWKEGDRIKRPDLAKTYEVIAKEGADAMYSEKGSLLPKLMKDLKAFGSVVTEKDFYNFKPRWLKPVSTVLRGNSKLYSPAVPGGGTLLVFMLNVLKGYDDLDLQDSRTWHRIIETFKHVYGARTRLGDPDYVEGIQDLLKNLTNQDYADSIRDKINDDHTYAMYNFYGANFTVPDDHGTAHVSVLAPNGDAIGITSTINDYFGAMLRSPSTGIILNGEMDDFSVPGRINAFGVPASPANFVAPKKRPLSSMSPTIVLDDKGDVQMIVGGAGGTRITTATLQLILRKFLLGQDLNTLMDGPRVHHQLVPMEVEYEEQLEAAIVDQLAARGHTMTKVRRVATMTAITRESDGSVMAAFDPRRPGSAQVVVELPKEPMGRLRAAARLIDWTVELAKEMLG